MNVVGTFSNRESGTFTPRIIGMETLISQALFPSSGTWRLGFPFENLNFSLQGLQRLSDGVLMDPHLSHGSCLGMLRVRALVLLVPCPRPVKHSK